MEYYFERISKANFDSFIAVFQACYPDQEIDKSFFLKKFDTEYTGGNLMGYLAFAKADKSPAAFYGVFPTLVKDATSTYLAAQSGNTATHPEHRKKGLFRLLHDKTMELCKAEGVGFVFGFPNEFSYPGFKKFGWSDKAVSTNMSLTVKVSLKAKLLRKFMNSQFHKFQQKQIENHRTSSHELASFKSSFVLLETNQEIEIPRSTAYMSYKLSLNSELIKLNNGIAWVSFQGNQIKIGDLFAKDLNLIMADLIEFAKQCGYDILLFNSPSNKSVDFLKRHFGFEKRNESQLIINYLNRTITDTNFYFTGGDFDTFRNND